MRQSVLVILVAFLAIDSPSTLAQGEAALPFLLFSPSPEANGMGGTSVAIRRQDPTGAIFAPAQIGLGALTTGACVGFYPSETEGPFVLTSDQSFSAWGADVGLLLNDVMDLPLRIGAGVAYNRVNLDLGEFIRTGSGGPDEIGRYDAYENASGLTLGVGVEYVARIGFGYTFRSITSHLSAVGSEQEQGPTEANVTAGDYSFLAELPLISITEHLIRDSLKAGPVRPMLDIAGGLARNNVGDKVVYLDPNQADPLPRTARAGIAVQAGVVTDLVGQGWDLLSFSWTQEAEDLLVVRDSTGAWEYQSGLGDIDLGTNLFQGELTDDVELRSGWQIQAVEIFSYREGSVESMNIQYETKGYTLRLAGLLKGIVLFAGPGIPSWLVFARDHIDIQYHWAEYSSLPRGFGSSFSGLTIGFHGVPG